MLLGGAGRTGPKGRSVRTLPPGRRLAARAPHIGEPRFTHTPLNKEASASHTPTLGGVGLAHSHSGGVHRSHTPLNKEASASHTPTLGGVGIAHSHSGGVHRSHTPLNKEASASHTPTLGGVGIAHSHSGGVHRSARSTRWGGAWTGFGPRTPLKRKTRSVERVYRVAVRLWGPSCGERTFATLRINPLDKAVNSSFRRKIGFWGVGGAPCGRSRAWRRAPSFQFPPRGGKAGGNGRVATRPYRGGRAHISGRTAPETAPGQPQGLPLQE